MLVRLLTGHALQLSFSIARRQHRHRNPHSSPVGAVHPWVVRYRKVQMCAFVQHGLHHTAVKGLAQAVSGDKAHALGLAGNQQIGSVLPPEHDEISALGYSRPSGAQGFGIAVAQGGAHSGGANKRRVTHNKVHGGPFGFAGAHIAPLVLLRALVRHLLARYRVGFGGGAVPAGQRLAIGIQRGLAAVPGEDGVAAFDVAVVVHHGLGHAGVAPAADVPLQVANPQHQFCQGGGTFVDLYAAQLLQGHGFAFKTQLILGVAQGL